MVTALSAKQVVLRGDGQFGTLTQICSYLDQPTVMCVSRAFRTAMRTELVEVGKRIAGRQDTLAQRTMIPDALRPEEGRKAVLEGLFQEVTSVMVRVPGISAPVPQPNQIRTPQVREAISRQEAWDTFSRKVQTFLSSQEELNLYQAARLYHSLVQIKGAIQGFLGAVHESLGDDDDGTPLTQDEVALLFFALDAETKKRILDQIGQALRMSNGEETLAQRFRESFAAPRGGIQLDPSNTQHISVCLAGLHTAQKELVFHYSGDQRFLDISTRRKGDFSSERFRELEPFAKEAQEMRDYDYESLWEPINEKFQQLGVNIETPPTTPLQIKAWLNLDENAMHLQQITELEINGVHYLPPEIGRLTNLRSLSCWSNGRLDSLPQEVENLVHLEELHLFGNGFRTIPEVIGRLANLRVLNLYSNHIRELPQFLTRLPHLRTLLIDLSPHHATLEVRLIPGNLVEILPDAVYRHVEDIPFIFPHLIRSLKACFYGQNDGITIEVSRLRQLPFQLWFENQLEAGLAGFIDGMDQYLGKILSFSVQTLIFIPQVVFGWILLDIIVPLTTLLRDLLGYGRMVTIEPTFPN